MHIESCKIKLPYKTFFHKSKSSESFATLFFFRLLNYIKSLQMNENQKKFYHGGLDVHQRCVFTQYL